jgi:hypothetical protein
VVEDVTDFVDRVQRLNAANQVRPFEKVVREIQLRENKVVVVTVHSGTHGNIAMHFEDRVQRRCEP